MDFTEIFNTYFKMVQNFIARKVSDKMVIEDLAMEVMYKVSKALPTYKDTSGKMSSWIFSTANNHVIDYWRKKKLQTLSLNVTDSDGNEYREIESPQSNPLNQLIVNEIIDLIKDKFNSYGEIRKEIANLYFVGQLSHDEIVTQMEIPLGTVKNNIHLVKQDLKKNGLI